MHSWFFRSKLKFSAPRILDSNSLKSDSLRAETLTGQYGPDWERSKVPRINPTLTSPAPTRAFREGLDDDARCQKVQQFGGEERIRTGGTDCLTLQSGYCSFMMSPDSSNSTPSATQSAIFRVLCRKPLGNACEPEVSENEHSPGEELARARLQEIAGRHLTEVEHKIHTAAASERAFAKAVVRVATEVDADLIVIKTHGRKGLSHLRPLPRLPCRGSLRPSMLSAAP